jgi:hypothetical protein
MTYVSEEEKKAGLRNHGIDSLQDAAQSLRPGFVTWAANRPPHVTYTREEEKKVGLRNHGIDLIKA